MAMTDADEWYFVYENRLASFQAPQPLAKRRASNANSRAPKTLTWPHKFLSPTDMAQAGFVFQPQPSNPDNVACFLCHTTIDGWEKDDDPLAEHLKHWPDCGWAITAAVEAEVAEFTTMHPLDPRMVEARKATFGGKWPYESKKAFKCKTKQLVEAGWRYTPTLESDDMTTCPYCHLGLDGWESGDKPIEEHYKRAPDCLFFQLVSQNPAPKKGRATKAARASKASRLSVQSVATATSEFPSAADVTVDHDDSVMTTTSVVTQGGRKTTRGRKAATTKGRKTRAKKDDAVEVLEDEQDVEVPPPPPPKATRGRKRASDAVEDSIITNAEAPAPKKRATRASVSNNVDASVLSTASQDIDMADAPPAKRPTSRKKGRASTARTTRKASSSSSLRSQASTASLRAQVPDDDELDRQLQADLERPLTDDEDVAADSDSERKKAEGEAAPAPAKRRARKGTTSKKATAQSQEEENNDYAMFDPAPPEPDEAEVDAELKALEAEMKAEEQVEVLEVPKKGRKAGTRKASKQTKKAKEVAQPPPDPVEEPSEEEAVMLVEPVPPPAPVPAAAPEPEVADDPDASNATVVTKTSGGRLSTGKRGRGRPPKNARTSQPADDEPEEDHPPPVPAHVEFQVASPTVRESFSALNRTPGKGKVVPSHTPSGPTPVQMDKALPLPPPFSIPRKPPATPRATNATPPTANAKQATLSPSQSPQSSDAENRPPSSKPPSSKRTALALAPVPATPVRGSPSSRRNVVAGLQSTARWTAVDLETVFEGMGPTTSHGVDGILGRGADGLGSPEKRMTVEEWIYHNAGLAERKLRHECEAMVSAFEREGTRAMGVLEELVVD
ncbi:hypothetical protein QBC33DRAFT_619082 [Phialemonium atrogriseum]|uniref:BIR-domain-containing protein n=1 Tax=Phialemonium atrogriseum TaxID=1093897 RepID=A0AAJ0FPJ7_9PEZI|nr:uncharacterized protein QBC33DRAFT_619082 [Phialemonium atrogriseum]KAK1768225.1 hypothetical protein QBC33DRAFT_619082 [Phialemonium atrogriseum]